MLEPYDAIHRLCMYMVHDDDYPFQECIEEDDFILRLSPLLPCMDVIVWPLFSSRAEPVFRYAITNTEGYNVCGTREIEYFTSFRDTHLPISGQCFFAREFYRHITRRLRQETYPLPKPVRGVIHPEYRLHERLPF